MSANKEKKSAWDGYRWRERMAYTGLVLLVVAAVLALFLPSAVENIRVAFFLGATLTVPMGLWRCPACRKRFFHAWYGGSMNPWRSSCVHCALRKWQEPPLSDEELAKRRLAQMKHSARPVLRGRQQDKE